MRTLIFLVVMSAVAWSCNDPVEYRDNRFDEVEVELRFDKFIPDVQVSPMAIANARSAAEGWTHIISEEMATVTIAGVNPAGEKENLILHKEFNKLAELTFSLKVGCTYTVTITPDDYNKVSTSSMIFDGESDPITVTSETRSVLVKCATPQSLVLIKDEFLSVSTLPKVEFYSSPDLSELLAAYDLGKSGAFYAMYIADLDLTYRYVIKKEDGEYANVKLYNITPGKMWTITANAQSASMLELDINGAFDETAINI